MSHNGVIIGITGASGAIYGVRLLQHLRALSIPSHLIISKAAHITIPEETGLSVREVQALADHVHAVQDIAACIASGSYRTRGMIIAPCSIKTMSEIATGVTSNLLSRAADVVLKERGKLVLLVRETPLHAGHLKTMLALTEMGAILAPPVPAFYTKPTSLEAMVDDTLGRALSLLSIESGLVKEWNGTGSLSS